MTEKKHAKFSASSAYRWLACAGSVNLCEKAPPSKDSPASIEGTLTHECLEAFLKNGEGKMLSTSRFLQGTHPIERVVRAESAARQIWKMTPKGAELLSETKSSLDHLHHDMHGTADAVIVEHFGSLYVIDYKNGKMPVEVEDNPQLIFYALGIAHSYDYNFADVILVVIQPLAEHAGGPVRVWRTDIEHLKRWGAKFQAGVKAAEKKNASFTAGEHCFFCSAKTICKTYTPGAVSSVRSKFFKPKTPEQIKLQLGIDFGQYIDTPKKSTKSKTKRNVEDDEAGF